ncbi:hypothetical protein [Ascidiaceihabitans donghaensis]|nr:hypothetical protein [Ascidiaceihabitans donghaensis]
MAVQGENLRALVFMIGGAFLLCVFHLGKNTSAGGILTLPDTQEWL